MGKSAKVRRRTDAAAPVAPYVGGFPTRDLARITDQHIARQEYGYSDGLSLPPVFAVVRLIASTIDQLDLTVDGDPAPEWLRSPRRYGAALDLGDLIQWTVTSMALKGAAYVLCSRTGDSWRLDALHPDAVQANPAPGGVVGLTFLLGGEPIQPVPALMAAWREGPYLLHIPYLVTPQYPQGVSPLKAAALSLAGFASVEAQAATLLGGGTYSGGRLETDQDITTTTARRWQTTWVEDRREGLLPVLGAGLRYVNDLIDPADAQWMESRQYNAQQVAMMFGVPPDYLGMSMSGGSSSLSYANSKDNDRRFRRNCLEAFTSQMEDALSLLMPQGRNAGEAQRVTFDYDAWEDTGQEPPHADDGSARVDPGPQPGGRPEPDAGGTGGPVRGGNPLWRVPGELRRRVLQPGEREGDAAALGAPEGRAGGPRDGGPEHPARPDGDGGRAADVEGPGRDHADSVRVAPRVERWIRTDQDQTGRDRRRGVRVRRAARTLLDPPSRLLRRRGDRDETPGGTRDRDD